MTVKALEHFPTVRLSNVGISVNTGLWFYEVHVLSDGLMQIGYIDADFVADPIQGQGVGDHTNSWGFDGFRCKKWNISSSDYGEPWRADDVVGVLLDTDRMELSFFLNGKFLGVAFSGLPMTPSSSMCPAASLNVNQIAQFNFGFNARNVSGQEYPEQMLSFAHIPALDSEQDQSRLQPVAIAIPPADNEKNEC
uniref:B30.2/SPRY domain-containing protein n=1 Tax=Globisporangium ultimum (strain ATCC 200006 / CBS 805.95 / DAOM BR144) TaxID=431595 RepID=K3WKH0_GLOUD